MSRVSELRAQGFDQSEAVAFRAEWHVGCSQCAAAVINGVACHETGCPNTVYECRGCNARVARSGAYCVDCS